MTLETNDDAPSSTQAAAAARGRSQSARRWWDSDADAAGTDAPPAECGEVAIDRLGDRE